MWISFILISKQCTIMNDILAGPAKTEVDFVRVCKLDQV